MRHPFAVAKYQHDRCRDAIAGRGTTARILLPLVAMPLSAAASAREILVNLHDVMAARTNVQAKLNHVVGIIGEALDSEVCSIYLRRDGVLELFATRGLAEEAGACHQSWRWAKDWSARSRATSRC